MTIIRNSSSEHTGKKNARQIYSGYRINVQANQLGIPAFPTVIKGASGDIVQSLRDGPTNFTPAELTAILNNNSGSTAPSGPPPGPPGPPPTPLTFTSDSPPSFPYTIPASYTLLTFTLIGGGGGGGNNGVGVPSAGGGGGGAVISASFTVSGGTVTFAKGIRGLGAYNANQGSIVYTASAAGTASSIVYSASGINISAGGGGGGSDSGGSGYNTPGSGGAGGTVIGNTSSVTTILSTPGTTGTDGSINTDDPTNTLLFPGYGGNNGIAGDPITGTVIGTSSGTGTGVGTGTGGDGNGGDGAGLPGTDGYWQFKLT
jgi:hypothetical protein